MTLHSHQIKVERQHRPTEAEADNTAKQYRERRTATPRRRREEKAAPPTRENTTQRRRRRRRRQTASLEEQEGESSTTQRRAQETEKREVNQLPLQGRKATVTITLLQTMKNDEN